MKPYYNLIVDRQNTHIFSTSIKKMKYKRRRRMIRVRTRSQSLINSKHPSVSEKSTKLDVILDHHHQNLKNEKRTKYVQHLLSMK